MHKLIYHLKRPIIITTILGLLLSILAPLTIPAPTASAYSLNDISSVLHHTENYDPNAECTGGTYTGATNGSIDKLQKVFAFRESGGNPTIENSAGGARGKYQYIDSTWKSVTSRYYGPGSQYPKASAAPEAVQDAAFHLEYTVKLKTFNNDMFKVIVSHYLPAANENPALLDVVPAPEAGNTITPRQYADKSLEMINSSGPWDQIPLKYNEAPEFATWLEKAGGSVSNSAGQTPDPSANVPTQPGSSTTGASPTPTSGGDQSVYILGDSIIDWFANADAQHAVQFGVPEKGLEKKLQEAKWKPTVNAKGGRQLSGTRYAQPDGLQVIEAEQENIRSADVVIVALGTNRDEDWEQNTKESYRQHVDQAIDRIKALNKNHEQAKIFWVNFAYAGPTLTTTPPGNYPYTDSFADYNQVIQEESVKKAFNIIDWKSQVDAHQNYIRTNDLGFDGYAHVHPTPEGTTAYTQMILTALSANAKADTSNGQKCNNTKNIGTAGMTELEYIDSSRPTPGVGDSRKIKVKVWGTDGQEKPLIVFAHGWSEGPTSYKRYIESLAAQGFVVAAPSFPLADKSVDGDKLNRNESMPFQPGDIKFVITQLLQESKLSTKIKHDAIGVVGHSDGAIAAYKVGYGAEKDSRINAVVAISGDAIEGLSGGPSLMVIHGDADTTAALSGDVANFNTIQAQPKYMVTLLGATHFDFVAQSTQHTTALDKISGAFLKNQLLKESTSIEELISTQFSQTAKVEKQ